MPNQWEGDPMTSQPGSPRAKKLRVNFLPVTTPFTGLKGKLRVRMTSVERGAPQQRSAG